MSCNPPKIKSLQLMDGEKLIIHRGLSAPICQHAESTHCIASQTKKGHQEVMAALFLPIMTDVGSTDLRFLDIHNISFKKVGEPNALIHAMGTPFDGWWCHMIEIENEYFGLIGRPRRLKFSGIRSSIEFPHITSTRKWTHALGKLTQIAATYIPDLKKKRYPHLAAAFDATKSSIEDSWYTRL